MQRFTLLTAAISAFLIACGERPPTGPAPGAEPGTAEQAGTLAYHLPWGGCTAWNGIPFNTVFFDPGSATLDDEDKASLDANIVQLNRCPNEGFHVQGEAVRERKARQVAAARAQAVAEYYENNGVLNPSRMAVISFVVPGCSKIWGPCSFFRDVLTY